MKRLIKGYVWLAITVCIAPGLYGQKTGDYAARIDSLVRITYPRSFNGVILITQKGRTKYARVVGYSDFEKKIPLRLHDNFRIQSNSKQLQPF